MQGPGNGSIGEVLYKDFFLVNQYPIDHFEFVLDVGANIGAFTMMQIMRNPNVVIDAYEPSDENYSFLQKNLHKFHKHSDLRLFKEGLGDGNIFYFDEGASTLARHMLTDIPEETRNVIEIKTTTLESMVTGLDLNQKTMFKFDCEGGEKYLLNDTCAEILKTVDHIGMEIHFVKSNGTGIFPGVLKFEEYNDWIHANLSDSHDIIYHRSSKHQGKGHFVLTKK